MKILYAIQTTGNGHLARAQNIIPRIKEVAELEIITSGPKNDFLLEEKPIKHFTGVTFFYTDNGSVNWLKTVFLNNYFRSLKEILISLFILIFFLKFISLSILVSIVR